MPKKGYSDVVERPDPTKSKPVSQEETIGRGGQKLGESDRRNIQLEVGQDEEAIAHAKAHHMEVPGGTYERLKRNKMILGHDDDLTPKSGGERDWLAARAREIESVLKEQMPTKREMWPKVGSPEAQRAVAHNLKFQERYGPMCKEWQEIQIRLNPEDPYAQSLETIRPD